MWKLIDKLFNSLWGLAACVAYFGIALLFMSCAHTTTTVQPKHLGRAVCAIGDARGIGDTTINADGSVTQSFEDGTAVTIYGGWTCGALKE